MTRIDYPAGMQAGPALTSALKAHQNLDRLLVLAIPPGGVSVAAKLANSLIDDVDVSIVRDLGVFFHHENTSSRTTENSGDGSSGQTGSNTLLEHGIAGRTVVVVPDTRIRNSRLLSRIRFLKSFNPGEIVIAQPTSPDRQLLRAAQA